MDWGEARTPFLFQASVSGQYLSNLHQRADHPVGRALSGRFRRAQAGVYVCTDFLQYLAWPLSFGLLLARRPSDVCSSVRWAPARGPLPDRLVGIAIRQ